MTVLVWILQIALSFLYLAGGGYKTFGGFQNFGGGYQMNGLGGLGVGR